MSGSRWSSRVVWCLPARAVPASLLGGCWWSVRVCWGVDNAVTASLDCYSPARITDGDTIVWETTGSADPAVQAILDQYIAIADNVGDGVAAMLDGSPLSGPTSWRPRPAASRCNTAEPAQEPS